MIAKWLLTDADLILLNDPTRGIDVGTKQEIYTLLRKLADSGKGVLFYSTDYAELIGCCDRVVILFEGRIVRELAGDDADRAEDSQRQPSICRTRMKAAGGGPLKGDPALVCAQ